MHILGSNQRLKCALQNGPQMNKNIDVFIVGGGINGAGIARDAAGRDQRVMLVEQDDLAGATSSASTKLIHGGLRYLENYEFRLVRESLLERETLWKMLPHLITPLRFVLPHHKGLRPAFILRLGLFLYDHIGGRKLLPAAKQLNLRKHSVGTPLQDIYKTGFEYSDCWVDDARLVILTALGAAERGAKILPRHTFLSAERKNGLWHIQVKTPDTSIISITAKVLINAAGPWVDKTLQACGIHQKNHATVRLVKGSHIIVPKLYDHDRAYTFQNADGRVIFAIPYEHEFTLIGTTDVPFEGDPRAAHAEKAEIAYLCGAASEYFTNPVTPNDVVWSYSGVRPLYDDGEKSASKATRDYVLDLETAENAAPLLNIYGGKITTHRCLAEEVMEKIAPFIEDSRGNWTNGALLPGGDMPKGNTPTKTLHSFIETLAAETPWLERSVINRLAHAYGTRVYRLLDGVSNLKDMGQHFGAGLYEREIRFLMREEWAQTADDVLWRRSKLGLHMTPDQRQAVANWIPQQNG